MGKFIEVKVLEGNEVYEAIINFDLVQSIIKVNGLVKLTFDIRRQIYVETSYEELLKLVSDYSTPLGGKREKDLTLCRCEENVNLSDGKGGYADCGCSWGQCEKGLII